jgi:hypothetical protein
MAMWYWNTTKEYVMKEFKTIYIKQFGIVYCWDFKTLWWWIIVNRNSPQLYSFYPIRILFYLFIVGLLGWLII